MIRMEEGYISNWSYFTVTAINVKAFKTRYLL